MTRAEALALGRKLGAKAGGEALKAKTAPLLCPRCGLESWDYTYLQYLGHLGLHGLADNHFGGDLQAAQRRLRENGQARQDPIPENGAWRPYRPVMEG